MSDQKRVAFAPDSCECLAARTDGRRLRGDRENDVILPPLLNPTQYLAAAAQETSVERGDDRAVVDGKG